MIKPGVSILNLASLFFLLLLPSPTLAQNAAREKSQAKSVETEATGRSETESVEAQRRSFALALVTSLASEAQSYRDLTLRSRVMARSADLLWAADSDAARVLFRRAWEAAEKADTDGTGVKSKDDPPPMVLALRRASGHDFRSEVLAIAASRDRKLGEEFLAKLADESGDDVNNGRSDTAASRSRDSWSGSEMQARRLQLASELLAGDQIERAVEFAAPALDEVNAGSIGFLTKLRTRKPEIADEKFASLMARAAVDPLSDANTALGLSSYVFTPGFYVTFSSEGAARWSRGDASVLSPPDLTASLRDRFFQVSGAILLRPLPPVSEDFSSSGRAGKYMALKRLLPLFDRYAPDTASSLRPQLTALSSEALKSAIGDESALLTDGIQPTETAEDSLDRMRESLDHAKTTRQRDEIFADTAVMLASQGNSSATDLADRIDNSERRSLVRQYVDFELVQVAIRQKQPLEIARLAKAGQLSHTQRAWAYVHVAKLQANTEPLRAREFLEEALAEARRIDSGRDRAVLLIGVSAQLVTSDRDRAWDIMEEAVKSANSTEQFTGEDVQLQFSLLPTRRGVRVVNFGGKEFGLSPAIRLLAKVDLYRSLDLVRGLKSEAPRAVATLSIARAVLEK